MMICKDLYVFFIFFIKQKTAYEMRISEWSSDVCSSDLQEVVGPECGVDGFAMLRRALPGAEAMEANVNRKIAGIYGQMLLSRLPVQRSRNIDLSIPRREPRRANDPVGVVPSGAGRRLVRAKMWETDVYTGVARE